ncbi:hypothetical protein STCU_11788 [Strigomonas culicis]|uniref:Uncharacterized protein n=1 Tax=Strigomonas culicis TaxID=28005 RepID=S9UM31_9TRYP|nr:hypothetical protein STCU_11788 [Strigomonas culicis]|eukprot:EPY15756.1 hypothetical protein STCU_11788 [Strigomonas culicis]
MATPHNDAVLESMIPDPDEAPPQTLSGGGAGAGDAVPLAAVALLLAPHVARWVLASLASFVVERVGKLVAVEGEAAKDAAAATETAAAPKRQLPAIVAAHHRLGGLGGLLRGAKVSLAFQVGTSVLDALLIALLRRAVHRVPARFHLLLIPPYLAAATLPLRTVRNLLTTNYICGVVADPPRYCYGSVGDVWRRLCAELPLRERLTLGWELDLCNRYLAIGLGAALQPLFVAVRDRMGPRSAWLPAALVALLAACTALHQPFTVLTLRLSLLRPPPARALRYSSAWDCLCTLVREEGVGALFAGWYCPVAWQHLLPLLQVYLVALGGAWRAPESPP